METLTMKTQFKMMGRTTIAILAASMLSTIGSSVWGQTTYTVIDLGVNVVPADINNGGDVVGSMATAPYGTVGIHYDVFNGLTELPGTRDAKAINDQGDFVGTWSTGGGYLMSGASIEDFGADYTASGINEVGQIAGSKSKANPHRPTPRPTDPAVYDLLTSQWDAANVARVYSRGTRKGVYADLYRLNDINDLGVSVGTKSRYGLYGSSSFLWSPGDAAVTWLPIPGGGEATAINNAGQVVGRTGIISGVYTGYVYDIGSDTLTDLGVLSGGTYSLAYDINDSGQVVGNSAGRGFVWQDGIMIDANSLLDAGSPWTITSANAINELGEIAAIGTMNGESHGLILVSDNGGGGGGDPVNAAPVAVVDVSSTTPQRRVRIKFDASASSDSDGTIVEYFWDFGDGKTATGIRKGHRYRKAGVYDATLTVTDDGGLTNSASVTITVE